MGLGTLLEPPPPVAEPEPEALIEEARARQRRRRLWIAAVLLAAVGLGLGLYAAFGGGGGLFGLGGSDGSGGAPSAVYHKGWIYHEQQQMTLVPYPGAGKYEHLVVDTWRETSPPYRVRAVTRGAFWSRDPVELGRSGTKGYFYDRKTDTVYTGDAIRIAYVSAPVPFVDPGTYDRQMLESGRWQIEKRIVVDGRPVIRARDVVAGSTYYIDARTYLVERTVANGFPLQQPHGKKVWPPCTFISGLVAPPTTAVIRLTDSEYLPPTKQNVKKLDVRARHPAARTAPASALPKQKQVDLDPSCGTVSP